MKHPKVTDLNTLRLVRFCLLAITALPLVASAAETTLLQAYHIARDSAPQLAIAAYRLDGAAAERDTARGAVLPQLTAFGEWSENEVEFEGAGIAPNRIESFPGERYGLQFRQTVFNLSRWRELKRLSAVERGVAQELEIAETELLGMLTEAYLNVMLADADVAQLDAELEALTQQFEESTALHGRSLLPLPQLLENQTRMESVRADLIAARAQTLVAREQLMQLVGVRDLDPLEVTDNLLLNNDVSSPEQAATIALAANPTVGAAQENVNAAQQAVGREKGTWLPQVDLVYNQQFSDVGFDNLAAPARTNETLSLSVNYPLVEGGAKSARLRGAWAQYYEARQRLEQAKRETEMRARSAWVNLTAATERVVATRQALTTAETSVDAARKAVRAGTARVTDVLLALAQNTRAQRDFTEARFQQILSWLELQLAMGRDPQAIAPRLSEAMHSGVTRSATSAAPAG